MDPYHERLVRNWTKRVDILMKNGIHRSDGLMIVQTTINFLCDGSNIYVPSVNREKYLIFSVLRAEIACGESYIMYRTAEIIDDVFEQLCMVGALEGLLR